MATYYRTTIDAAGRVTSVVVPPPVKFDKMGRPYHAPVVKPQRRSKGRSTRKGQEAVTNPYRIYCPECGARPALPPTYEWCRLCKTN